jgi:hypothetical protein
MPRYLKKKEQRFVVINGDETSHEMNDAEACEFIFDLVTSNARTCFRVDGPEDYERATVTTITCV